MGGMVTSCGNSPSAPVQASGHIRALDDSGNTPTSTPTDSPSDYNGGVKSFAVQPSAVQVNAGQSLSLTVTAVKNNGMPDVDFMATVHFASTDASALLPGNYSFTNADQGVHVFQVVLNTPGNQTVSVNGILKPEVNGTSQSILVLQTIPTPTPTSTPSTVYHSVAAYYFSNCSSNYFCTGTGFSGCTNNASSQSPDQYIVAMNSTDLGSIVSCNQCIQITDTANGNTILARVVDNCPGCDGLHGPHALDVDPSAAVALDPNYATDGTFNISWSVNANCAPLPSPVPTKSPTPTPTNTPGNGVYQGGASYYFSNCSSAYFCTGGGFPGCTNGASSQSPDQYIVAMNSTDLGSIVSCNQCIQITDTANGNTIQAKIVDNCPGCDGLHGPHSLDLDPSAATALDPNYATDGVFNISWSVMATCPVVSTVTPAGTPTFTPTPTATSTPGNGLYQGGASYYFSNCSSAYFCTGGGFPGCTNNASSQSPDQYIVAMNSTDLGSIVSCNQCIQITDTANGNTIQAKIVDNCPGCDGLHGPHSLDLDPSAAVALDPNYATDGVFNVSWSVNGTCP